MEIKELRKRRVIKHNKKLIIGFAQFYKPLSGLKKRNLQNELLRLLIVILSNLIDPSYTKIHVLPNQKQQNL